MTADTTPVEPAASVEPTDGVTPGQTADDVNDRPDVAEARKYRKRAQDAETERDHLRGRVDVLQRSELARIVAASDTPIHPAVDLTEVFPVLDDLRTEDGDLDTEAITAAVEQLRTARPYLFEVKPTANLARFQGPRDDIPTGTTWAEALAP